MDDKQFVPPAPLVLDEAAIQSLRNVFDPQVRTSCDEYHGHSWEKDCFSSDNPVALLVCRLLDEIKRLKK